MTSFANAIQNTIPQSKTANGMTTLAHSGDPVTTLFFAIGSSRGKDLVVPFTAAFAHNPLEAMKVLFWARDAREGQGERETFRRLLRHLEVVAPDTLMKNIDLIAEFGRWDDGLVLTTRPLKLAYFARVANALREGNGLAAKWMPRKGKVANELRKYMNFTPAEYRHLIVRLSNTVETKMCARQWDQINYDHVPSLAASRYQKAFNKRDSARYAEWKAGLKTGVSKVNASVLYPYDVLKGMSYGDVAVSAAQWEALPDYLGDNKILPMVDVSSSMEQPVGGQSGVGMSCMDMSVALGLYIADKQKGAFKDCFLTFNTVSKLQVLKGNIQEKVYQLRNAQWGGSTSLESGFKAILKVATENNVPAEEMPEYLLVLSDMEFNPRNSGTNIGAFDLAGKMFSSAGYALPKIIWWNLNARPDGEGNTPVKHNQEGAALVSGYSPSTMKSILSAKSFTPRDVMLETINAERYSVVVV